MEIRCWQCGEEVNVDLEKEWEDYLYRVAVMSKEYTGKAKQPEGCWKRVYCEECEKSVALEKADIKDKHIKYKLLMQIEKAINTLEKQHINLYRYRESIKTVEDFATKNPQKFDSSYEIIAAIILIHNRIHAKAQYSIDPYRVDFYLPTLKCILEIDGERHNGRELYDSNRDIKLRNMLGADWEVVRIPTKYLDQNAKMLVEAIKQLKREKQKVRAANGGIIPSYYSKRDKAKSKQVEGIVEGSDTSRKIT